MCVGGGAIKEAGTCEHTVLLMAYVWGRASELVQDRKRQAENAQMDRGRDEGIGWVSTVIALTNSSLRIGGASLFTELLIPRYRLPATVHHNIPRKRHRQTMKSSKIPINSSINGYQNGIIPSESKSGYISPG